MKNKDKSAVSNPSGLKRRLIFLWLYSVIPHDLAPQRTGKGTESRRRLSKPLDG